MLTEDLSTVCWEVFRCVHTMPEAWSTQSKTLDKAWRRELAKNWLMIQESHGDADPARDKDSGGRDMQRDYYIALESIFTPK